MLPSPIVFVTLAAIFLLAAAEDIPVAPPKPAADWGLRIKVVFEPTQCRERAAKHKFLLVHYESVTDESSPVGVPGTLHHSTKRTGLPIDVELEPRKIIPGWVQGLDGMCEGSRVELVVPPALGEPTDPAGQILRYDIEILKVSITPLEGPNVFAKADANGDGQISVEEFSTFFNNVNDGKPVPFALFHREDINQDGFVDWYEFTGPKGSEPPAGMAIKETAPKAPEKLEPKTVDLLNGGKSQIKVTTGDQEDKAEIVLESKEGEKVTFKQERGRETEIIPQKKSEL